MEDVDHDCIEITDVDEHWLVCNEKKEELKKLECAIKKFLGEKCDDKKDDDKNKDKKKFL